VAADAGGVRGLGIRAVVAYAREIGFTKGAPKR
jgi:hypothetical protein